MRLKLKIKISGFEINKKFEGIPNQYKQRQKEEEDKYCDYKQ